MFGLVNLSLCGLELNADRHTRGQRLGMPARSRVRIVKVQRIRWLSARRLNELSQDTFLMAATLRALRSGLAAPEAEPRPEIPGLAETDMVEDELELQLRAPDAVNLEERPESVNVRAKDVPTTPRFGRKTQPRIDSLALPQLV